MNEENAVVYVNHSHTTQKIVSERGKHGIERKPFTHTPKEHRPNA